jgi:hypothetical protein
MKENKRFLTGIVVGIVFLLVGISFLPSTIGNSNSDENYNLNVVLRPDSHQKHFRHIYYGNGLPIRFDAGAHNEGPESSPEFTLKFEVIKIFPKESYEYNDTADFPSMPVGPTEVHLFTWYTLEGFHFGIYEVRATIDVNDNYLLDNTEDYSIIILH